MKLNLLSSVIPQLQLFRSEVAMVYIWHSVPQSSWVRSEDQYTNTAELVKGEHAEIMFSYMQSTVYQINSHYKA